MIISEIKKMPIVVDRNHESILQAFQILQLVKEMLKRGDSQETISMVIEHIQEREPKATVIDSEVNQTEGGAEL